MAVAAQGDRRRVVEMPFASASSCPASPRSRCGGPFRAAGRGAWAVVLTASRRVSTGCSCWPGRHTLVIAERGARRSRDAGVTPSTCPPPAPYSNTTRGRLARSRSHRRDGCRTQWRARRSPTRWGPSRPCRMAGTCSGGNLRSCCSSTLRASREVEHVTLRLSRDDYRLRSAADRLIVLDDGDDASTCWSNSDPP
jgi:hypothetical protein